MSEEEIRQDLMDIRYFAERMLRGLYEHDDKEQVETLFQLARLISEYYPLSPTHTLMSLISYWNSSTCELRNGSVTDDAARQTVFRIIGEIFGKYNLPDPGYEEDEL